MTSSQLADVEPPPQDPGEEDHSPDAVDVSDLKAAQDVGTQLEAERRIIEMERKRLRLETPPSAEPNKPLDPLSDT